MTAHYNKLTPAEAERLAMLAEEAAELIGAATAGEAGAAGLRHEMLDVYAVVRMMEPDLGVVPVVSAQRIEDLQFGLIRQASKVIQLVTKTLRHGYASFHPAAPERSNRELLREALSGLLVRMTLAGLEIETDAYRAARLRKLRYARHQNGEAAA